MLHINQGKLEIGSSAAATSSGQTNASRNLMIISISVRARAMKMVGPQGWPAKFQKNSCLGLWFSMRLLNHPQGKRHNTVSWNQKRCRSRT